VTQLASERLDTELYTGPYRQMAFIRGFEDLIQSLFLAGEIYGEVLALVTEHALGDLDDAWRIATANSAIPYSPPLEDAFLPGRERIVPEIRGRLA
jgi:hypothetical protein